jgi:hypothetical protein
MKSEKAFICITDQVPITDKLILVKTENFRNVILKYYTHPNLQSINLGQKVFTVFKYERSSQIQTGFLFSSTEVPTQNKITLLVVREEITITITTYHCASTCFLSLVITINEQVAPLAVAQCIIV